ncbi:MAG: hypothetical protein CL897_02555 [Dehalococcoidia bacterium]|nr:hypothetical protein [Dehalococcoidia bacterium]HCV00701.1 hypothetical protein [Dehalococcoidia bacterium]|tara:strand:- start:5716 stop:6840 length:1125 start_codon:yes stop_codon:yes gene_type:complete
MVSDQQVDVAIVGGGVIGTAIAYFLSQQGLQAFVIEGTQVAHGASGKAAGLLSPGLPHYENAELLEPLLTRSIELHQRFAEVLNGPTTYDYRPYETCLIARDDNELTSLHSRASQLNAKPVAPEEIPLRFPWIDRPVAGGLTQQTAQLDCNKFTHQLVANATKLGASVHRATAVGLLRGEGSIDGVQLEDGRVIRAKSTVIAMGPWSLQAAPWLDLPIPVRPLKGQILHLHPLSEAPPGGFSDMAGHYVVTRPNGLVFAGTTEEEDGFNVETSERARAHILSKLAQFTSRLRSMTVVKQTACLRPLSGDGLPLIGGISGQSGIYIATGHGRKGIILSLATAEAIVQLITQGRSSEVDLSSFNPDRFRRGESHPG